MSERWKSGPLQEQFNHADGSVFGCIIRLYWTVSGTSGHQPTHWIDFEIFEAVGLDGVRDDSPPLYYATESRELSDGVTTDLDKAVPDVSGFVKWDGCTQVYFSADRDTPALHYDDRAGLAGILAAIVRAQERCYEIMAVDA